MKRFFRQPARSIVHNQADWQVWERQPLGQTLRSTEKALLTSLLAQRLGQSLLQLSIAGCQPVFSSCPIPHQTFGQISSADDNQTPRENCDLFIEPCHLPIANNSLDALILHHVLEYTSNPHQVLREAHRALDSGGQLFILAFNPWSLIGLRRALTPVVSAPWAGSYRSISKINDWLKLLGFSVERVQCAFYQLPWGNARFNNVNAIEQLGRKYNCFFGGIYAIVARKQTLGMTPLREPRFQHRVLPFPVSEPSVRSYKSSGKPYRKKSL